MSAPLEKLGPRHLVVGANRGIGLEFVRQLLGDPNCTVIGTYRDPEKIDELSKISSDPLNAGRLSLVRLDMMDDQSCKDAAEEVKAKLGYIDILIVNAGINGGKPLLTEEISNVSRLFDNNVLGPLRICQAFVPLLKGRPSGDAGVQAKLVLITSESGSLTTSKHGRGPGSVRALTLAILGWSEYDGTQTCVRAGAVERDSGAFAPWLGPGGHALLGNRVGIYRSQTDMGGPNAVVSPEESVRGMLRVIDELGMTNSGEFWAPGGSRYHHDRIDRSTMGGHTLDRLPHITRRDLIVSLLTSLLVFLFLSTTRHPQPPISPAQPLVTLSPLPKMAPKGNNSERSYIMVKPDGVQRALVGEIIGRFERRGFKIVALKLVHATKEHLEKHYADLSDKPFFPGLIKYMASGPVVAIVIEGLDAVKTGRAMLGATNPLESGPGTIRGDYALSVGRNICHGSDSVASAEKEIQLWFPEGIVQYTDDKATWILENN
ncbi:Nucleoside-diphosphate kinase [Ceratobasidium theobromae]|uniref:Nucleoside diphosphate kinase n=1 Tax=Ceratobasidium theobromae TaxID=1582974 RepID=A0A5N5QVV9_9AGAM|nr:Nucleoside-diphosphate kinase [Ceratobasidium theobromae]